jgi:excinuclease ABC subunit C
MACEHVVQAKLLKGIIPKSSGIYKMLGDEGRILYIGKAKNLFNRLKSYMQFSNLDTKTSRMISLVVDVEIITTQTEAEALILEASLIKAFFPPYNILLKDDRSLPFIALDLAHEFPSIFKYRGKKQSKIMYFGPFGSSDVVFEIIDLVQKIFKLRTCSDSEFKSRKRACIKHQIKLCSAPCVNKVGKEDYASKVTKCINFFNAKDDSFKKDIVQQMSIHAEKMEFEEAILLRNTLEMVAKIQQKGDINFANFDDTDVVCLMLKNNVCAVQIFFVRNSMSFGSKVFFPQVQENSTTNQIMEAFLMQFYESNQIPKEILINIAIENEKAIQEALGVRIHNPKLGKKYDLLKFTISNLETELEKQINSKSKIMQNLTELKEFLNLNSLPKRIDVFDNSHNAGTDFIGAMIVCGQDGFLKKEYRKYNVKYNETKAGDDYAMMREVMRRRYSKIEPESKPDLIVIDGGKGQLSAVAGVFEEIGCNIPFICISKGLDRNAGKEKFHTLSFTDLELKYNSSLLFYFQNIRDEAHRFAISTHRLKRSKSFIKSQIDEIDGVGLRRKKLLLEHFGSVANIKSAKIEDLSKVNGISKSLAQQIYDSLH